MIQDTLKPEIKNDIENTLSKHGLMRGDKYAAEILQELATEFSKSVEQYIVSMRNVKDELESILEKYYSLTTRIEDKLA